MAKPKIQCLRCAKMVRVVSENGHCRDCVKKLVNIENRARAEARRLKEKENYRAK